MKIVYIAHPIGGDVEENLKKIAAISRQINLEEPDVVPFAPYYLDCVSLDDSDPVQRERGIKNNLELLNRHFVNELRLYGTSISKGMIDEISFAWYNYIDVTPMTEETKKEYDKLLDTIY